MKGGKNLLPPLPPRKKPHRISTVKARNLRVQRTKAENVMWQAIRNRQLGHKFKFQFPVGRYIADFICLELKLVLEVDGGQHCESKTDDVRTRILEAEGYTVVRFWNNDVLDNLEGVVSTLTLTLTLSRLQREREQTALLPLPPLAGEGRGPRRGKGEGIRDAEK